jgi:hypothetical protein
MAGATVLLIVGTLLLLVAGAVGGSRGRAIGLQGAGSTARFAIGGVGLMCVLAGSILLTSGDEPKGPVTATIMCELDPRLTSEAIAVYIDKRSVGVIRMDKHSPKAELQVTVSKAGRHDYGLEARRRTAGGERKQISHADQLVIDGKHPLLVYYSDDKAVEPFLSQPLKY